MIHCITWYDSTYLGFCWWINYQSFKMKTLQCYSCAVANSDVTLMLWRYWLGDRKVTCLVRKSPELDCLMPLGVETHSVVTYAGYSQSSRPTRKSYCKHHYLHSVQPGTKLQVDRMTHCRVMTIWNSPDCVNRPWGRSSVVNIHTAYTDLIYSSFTTLAT